MGTVGNLWINVKANTKGLDKGINKSKKSINGFKGALAGIGVAVGAAFALKAVKDFAGAITKAMDRIDVVAKFAKSINVSTEAVQVFRHAATLTGVSVGEADKALGKMVKNVGEASMGIGTATDAFKALGLSTEEMSNMQADQMFGHIAEAIMQVDNRAQQASLAYDVFGRAGMKLLNTMEMGASGMRDLRSEMKSMGVLFSSMDAAGVERANDAMATLGVVVDSVFQKLAIELAPMIEEFSNNLTAFASDKEFQKTIESIGLLLIGLAETAMVFGKSWTSAVEDVSKSFSGLYLILTGDVSLGLASVATGIGDLLSMGHSAPWEFLASQAESINDIGDAAEIAAKKTRSLAEEAAALETAKLLAKEIENLTKVATGYASQDRLFAIHAELEQLDSDYRKINTAIQEGTLSLELGNAAVHELTLSMDELVREKWDIINPESLDTLTKTKDELQDIGDALTESMQTPIEMFAVGLAEIDTLLAAGVISLETYNRALEDLKSSIPSEPLEVNIIAKGVVEGIQTALGTMKVAGQVNRTEQLAEQSNKIQSEMKQSLKNVQESSKTTSAKIAETTSAVKEIKSKIGSTSVKTTINGLQRSIEMAIKSHPVRISTPIIDGLLREANSDSRQSLIELRGINQTLSQPPMPDGGGGGGFV